MEKLDPERQKAVEEALKAHPELEGDLESLKKGLTYTNSLQKVDVSEPLYNAVAVELTAFQKLARITGWVRWPAPVRFGIAAVLVALVAAQTYSWISWRFENDTLEIDYTLAKATRENRLVEKSSSEEEKGLTSETVGGAEKSEPQDPPGEVAVTQPREARENPTPVPEVTETDTKSLPAPKPTPEPEPQKKPEGFVYRAFMFSDRVDDITEEIAAQIKNFGGQKAGEVPLGWRRKDGSYFHFTVPEEKYPQVTDFLATYGKVKIVKDPHPRIMAEGTIRFIFWLEKVDKPKAKAEDEK
jgi:hypothetical protein